MKQPLFYKIISVLIITLFVFTACSGTPNSTENNQPITSPQQNTTAAPAETTSPTEKSTPAAVTKTAAPAATDKTVNAVAKTVKVNIVNFAFNPSVVSINKGDTVIWTNSDKVGHTAIGSAFDSGLLSKGAAFKFTFNTADTFDYICTPHPYMKGQIIVK